MITGNLQRFMPRNQTSDFSLVRFTTHSIFETVRRSMASQIEKFIGLTYGEEYRAMRLHIWNDKEQKRKLEKNYCKNL